ncbi:MAG: DMT family transporter [Promethearchaeota archaeon]
MLSVYLLLILMINVWAFSFIVVNIAINYIPPMVIAFYRFLVSSILYLLVDIYLFFFRKNKNSSQVQTPQNEKFNGKEWFLLMLATQFGVILFFLSQYNAIQLIGPSLPALFVCLLSPVFIAIFSLIFFKEKLNKLKSLGFLLASIGGFFLVTGGDISSLNPSSSNFLGIFLALLTPLFWAIYTMLTKKLMQNHGTNMMLKYIAYLGAIELFLYIYLNGELIFFFQQGLNWVVIISALYLGPVCYVLGYFIWQNSQRTLTSSNVASFLYVEPFITLLFSYVLNIEEIVKVGNIIGGLIVLIAVFMINCRVHD